MFKKIIANKNYLEEDTNYTSWLLIILIFEDKFDADAGINTYNNPGLKAWWNPV